LGPFLETPEADHEAPRAPPPKTKTVPIKNSKTNALMNIFFIKKPPKSNVVLYSKELSLSKKVQLNHIQLYYGFAGLSSKINKPIRRPVKK
jgi:hypothetical protein